MSYTVSKISSITASEVAADPYPFYQRLRTEAPLYWDEGLQKWLVTRYADVIDLLRNPRFTVMPPDNASWEARRHLREMFAPILLFHNPPAHTRMRAIMEHAFNPLAAKMGDRIQQVSESLLDGLKESQPVDMMSDFAISLPSIVHSELLGVPSSDASQLREWVHYFAHFAFGTGYAPITQEDDEKTLENMRSFADYFSPLIEQRRQNPKEDLISALATAEIQGEKLGEQELLMNVVFLCVGGYGSIPVALCNCLLGLALYPKQMEKLQDNPTLIESAIEELLRYESQVQWVPRCALEDIEVHGQLIHQNQVVMFGLGAANRDPLRFSEPDQVDITRTDNRHVAFGFTPHSCFGVPLARPFLRIAIKAVLQRMKGLRLATDQLEWIEAPVFRALKSLPITFA